MKTVLKKQLALLGLFVGLVVFLGLLFWPFVMANIIQPVAMSMWLLLRIFILSIDQKYYWGALIFLGLVILVRRLTSEAEVERPVDSEEQNDTLRDIEGWAATIRLATNDQRERHGLQRDLTHLMVSLYTPRRQDTPYHEVFEPLERGEIPLPDRVHALLFANLQLVRTLSLRQRLSRVLRAPARWLHKWSGRDAREYRQQIEEVIYFMETTLENNHDQ